MAVTSTDKRNVLFTQVRLPKGFNIRGDELPEAERDTIIRSFEEHGVIHDASVEEHVERVGKKRRKVYLVTEGFGRMGALLYMWEKQGRPADWTVTVTVVTYSSRLDPFMRNLAENVHRRGVKQADLARRLSQIVKGELPDPKGGWVKDKASTNALAEKLQLSPGFVRDLVRAWDKAIPAVRDAWRAEKVRTDHVRAWAALPEKAQALKLEAHLRGEQTLAPRPKPHAFAGMPPQVVEANGEGPRSGVETREEEAGASGKGETPRGVEPRPRESKDDDGPRPPSRAEIAARAEAIAEDLESGEYKGPELALRRAAWNALRWACGEVRSMRLS